MLDIAPIAPVWPQRIVGRHFPAGNYATVKVNGWIITDRTFADGGAGPRPERRQFARQRLILSGDAAGFAAGGLVAGVLAGAHTQ